MRLLNSRIRYKAKLPKGGFITGGEIIRIKSCIRQNYFFKIYLKFKNITPKYNLDIFMLFRAPNRT
ncbi:hypothetical protein CAP42_09465 [Acinetobacter indicus]|nr:hypothetical protein CAP42_09465 [Acinetobacter indicus]